MLIDFFLFLVGLIVNCINGKINLDLSRMYLEKMSLILINLISMIPMRMSRMSKNYRGVRVVEIERKRRSSWCRMRKEVALIVYSRIVIK